MSATTEIAARQRDVWVSHCDGTVPPQIRPLDWLMVMHECDLWKGPSDCPRLMLACAVDWQWGGVLAFKIVIAAPGYGPARHIQMAVDRIASNGTTLARY